MVFELFVEKSLIDLKTFFEKCRCVWKVKFVTDIVRLFDELQYRGPNEAKKVKKDCGCCVFGCLAFVVGFVYVTAVVFLCMLYCQVSFVCRKHNCLMDRLKLYVCRVFVCRGHLQV